MPVGNRRTPLSVTTSLTLPRLSCTRSVTVIGNHVVPAGNGGAGMMAQFTFGIVNTGPVVVCENIVDTPYVQSHATMAPGPDEVLPLNVQLSVAPLFDSAHVSVSVGPLTPKLAIATVGLVTERIADADAPP